MVGLMYQWFLFGDLEDALSKLLNEKNYDELEKKCEVLMSSNVKYKQYYAFNAIAVRELKKKSYEKAEEYANKAIELMPSEDSAYKTMVDIFFQQKDINKAYYYILQSAAKSSLNYNMCVASGKLFTFTEKYDEAIKMYELASSENNLSPVPLIAIAFVHYLNRNNTKAIDFIREARKKINPNITSHIEVDEWAKGLLAIMSGDFKEACYIFDYYSEESDFGPIFDLILDKVKKVFRSD